MNYIDIILRMLRINNTKDNQELLDDIKLLLNQKCKKEYNIYIINNIKNKYQKEISEIDNNRSIVCKKNNIQVSQVNISNNEESINVLIDYLYRIALIRLSKSFIDDQIMKQISSVDEKNLYELVTYIRDKNRNI